MRYRGTHIFQSTLQLETRMVIDTLLILENSNALRWYTKTI